MAIGDTKFSGQTPQAPSAKPVDPTPSASMSRFFLALGISAGAIALISLVDVIWNLSTFRLWFVIPAGQIGLGVGVGAMFGLTYRFTQGMPVRREFVLCGVASMFLAIWGDWFCYQNLTFDKDGQKVVVSEVVPFGDYFQLHFHGKRELRAGRGSAKISEYEANPGYEMLMYGLGVILMGVAAGAVFHSMTKGALFCDSCKKYFKKTKSHSLRFSSSEELIQRIAASDQVGFGTLDSIKEVLRPVQDATPEKKRHLMLTVAAFKCNCGKQIVSQAVSKLGGNNWSEVGELARKAYFGPSNREASDVIEELKKAS